MTDRALDALPDPLARAVRTAPVPASLRVLFARLPAGATLDADLPARVEDAPLAARQLVKLASLGGGLALARVAASDALRLRVARGDRELTLGAGDLGDVRAACARVVEALFPPAPLARALEAFAAESATLSTLHALTRHMLGAPDLDHALHAMLSGVTSSWGLAFHRAALFVHDAREGAFVGRMAIGPADEHEAHRIWEEIEASGKALEQIVADYGRKNFDGRFESFVKTLALRPGAGAGDEVAAALAAAGPLVFDGPETENASLGALRARGGFVLAAIAPGAAAGGDEELRALLFADDAWSDGRPIAPERALLLGSFLDQLALVWENRALLHRVERLARVDALTGVENRRVFEEKLAVEQSRARRSGAPLSVLALDVDRFKEINDSRGHAAGDDALRTLAGLLAHAVREHDSVARVGGDEFAVILPGVGREEALAVARRVGAVAKLAGISVSVGGASFPEDDADPAALLALADAALYAAKRAGRGRARVGGGLEAEL